MDGARGIFRGLISGEMTGLEGADVGVDSEPSDEARTLVFS